MSSDEHGVGGLSDSLLAEKRAIERGGRLRWVHWAVLGLSVALTLAAWQISRTLVEQRAHRQFDRDASQVVELINERMEKYEEALRSGVSAIYAMHGVIDYPRWKVFADSLQIGTKYPGINGIGVIDRVAAADLPAYLAAERRYRPGFAVHPVRAADEYLPISFIEPVAGNRRAVGLDVSHEVNRRVAAHAARDTGQARITAPIVLVQDTAGTPGFLFYMPWYAGEATPATVAARRRDFRGIVYAPFIVRKLMAGTLDKEKRNVGVRIRDGGSVLYDEHTPDEPDYDPNPLFRHQAAIDMYGRRWTFDVFSTRAFRAMAHGPQPLFILIGGIVIDCLLMALFYGLTRANRRATRFAAQMSQNYQEKAEDLERLVGRLAESNEELERFAYVASHDLQEPLRMVRGFSGLLESRYADRLDETGRKYVRIVSSAAARMQRMVEDILSYARLGSEGDGDEHIDCNEVMRYVVGNLEDRIRSTDARVTWDELPVVAGNGPRLARLLQNLVGNGIKYQDGGAPPAVHVRAVERGDMWEFEVADNGIGIDPAYVALIFQPFKRLHGRDAYPGTGMGLAISRKIVEGMGGRIRAEPGADGGSRFVFTVPRRAAAAELREDAA